MAPHAPSTFWDAGPTKGGSPPYGRDPPSACVNATKVLEEQVERAVAMAPCLGPKPPRVLPKCMPTVRLPFTGDDMPAIGLGTFLAKPGEVGDAVRAAIDAGYRVIDSAWIYGNEEEVGQAIRDKIKDRTVERKGLWVTGKLWNNFHEPERVRKGVVQSLERLGLDYFDLFVMHYPVAFKGKDDCIEAVDAEQVGAEPLHTTWKAMEQLIDEGLARNLGVANFEVRDLKKIQGWMRCGIAVNQIEVHPYYPRTDLVEYCTHYNIVVTAHTCLGGAQKDSPFAQWHKSPPVKDDPVVVRIAAKHATTPHAVLLRWALQRPIERRTNRNTYNMPEPSTAILPMSTNPAHIVANLDDTLRLTLDGEDLSDLEDLDKGEEGNGRNGCYTHPATPWFRGPHGEKRSDYSGVIHFYGPKLERSHEPSRSHRLV